jgi:non-heme chloroperoxidase
MRVLRPHPTIFMAVLRFARFVTIVLGIALGFAAPAWASPPIDHYFRASDGARLHYIEAGQGPTIVFVPGWTMPADIWAPQIRRFAERYRVVAFDPRGQGKSDVAADGYAVERRAADIHDLIAQLGPEPVVLVGWSLGVLESLAYVKFHGSEHLRALVLVDNSIGEEPPPSWDPTFLTRLRRDRLDTTRQFVRSMYRTPQPAAYIDSLVRDSLRMPIDDAVALLSYPFPRTLWKQIVYQTDKPILYAVTERYRGQAENLKRNRPGAWIDVFDHAGHALFVDDAARFDRLLSDFLVNAVGLAGADRRVDAAHNH